MTDTTPFDGNGLWISAVRQGRTGNMLTRVSAIAGQRIAPFDAGPLAAAGKVNIPGTIAQGLVYERASGGRTYGHHRLMV